MALATKLADLSPLPGIYMVEGKKKSTSTRMYTQINTCINVIFFWNSPLNCFNAVTVSLSTVINPSTRASATAQQTEAPAINRTDWVQSLGQTILPAKSTLPFQWFLHNSLDFC